MPNLPAIDINLSDYYDNTGLTDQEIENWANTCRLVSYFSEAEAENEINLPRQFESFRRGEFNGLSNPAYLYLSKAKFNEFIGLLNKDYSGLFFHLGVKRILLNDNFGKPLYYKVFGRKPIQLSISRLTLSINEGKYIFPNLSENRANNLLSLYPNYVNVDPFAIFPAHLTLSQYNQNVEPRLNFGIVHQLAFESDNLKTIERFSTLFPSNTRSFYVSKAGILEAFKNDNDVSGYMFRFFVKTKNIPLVGGDIITNHLLNFGVSNVTKNNSGQFIEDIIYFSSIFNNIVGTTPPNGIPQVPPQ